MIQSISTRRVVNVKNLKQAAYNVANKMGYAPASRATPLSEGQALGDFWFFPAKRLPLPSLLMVLNISHSKEELLHDELTLYLWTTHQKMLITALKHPTHCADAWKALEKLNVLHPKLARKILSEASKAKMFAQSRFRENINVIAALEANATHGGNNPLPLLNIALKDDQKFAKRTLQWAFHLKLTTELDPNNIRSNAAKPIVLSNIENGNISEKGVDEYLKWARSPVRLWDRIVFSITGPAYFDKNKRPHPPSTSFIEQVAAALAKKRKRKLHSTEQCHVVSPQNNSNQDGAGSEPAAGNVITPTVLQSNQSIISAPSTPIADKTMEPSATPQAPTTPALAQYSPDDAPKTPSLNNISNSTQGMHTPLLAATSPSSPQTPEGLKTPPLSQTSPNSSSSSASSGSYYRFDSLMTDTGETLAVASNLCDGKIMLKNNKTSDIYLGTYNDETKRLAIKNNQTGIEYAGIVKTVFGKYLFICTQIDTPSQNSHTASPPDGSPRVREIIGSPSASPVTSQTPPTPNFESISPSNSPSPVGTPALLNISNETPKTNHSMESYAHANSLMNNSPGSPKPDKKGSSKGSLAARLEQAEPSDNTQSDNYGKIINATPANVTTPKTPSKKSTINSTPTTPISSQHLVSCKA